MVAVSKLKDVSMLLRLKISNFLIVVTLNVTCGFKTKPEKKLAELNTFQDRRTTVSLYLPQWYLR